MGDDCLVLPSESSFLLSGGHHMLHMLQSRGLFSHCHKEQRRPVGFPSPRQLVEGMMMTVGLCSPRVPMPSTLWLHAVFVGQVLVVVLASLVLGEFQRLTHVGWGDGHGAQVWLVSRSLLPSYLAMGTHDSSPPCTLSPVQAPSST